MECRILAVEDSDTQAEALRLLLEQEGHRVTLARSADEALARLAAAEFDVVLSDVVMPGMSGYQLCRRIKEHPAWGRLPVVLLTSLNDPMDIVQGLECGADNYITKPYDGPHLLARIRNVLDNRKLRRDAKASLGVTVRFLGRDLTITSDREQILDLFISSVEDVVRANEALQQSQWELAEAHAQLEDYAQQKAREARSSAERYRALLQNAGDAIFVLDMDGRVLEANQRAEAMVRRSAAEIEGRSLLELVPEAGRGDFRALLARLAEEPRVVHAEHTGVDETGNRLWYELTASVAVVHDESLVLLIARDVSGRRRMEEELRRREQQLSEAQRIARFGSWERDLRTEESVWSPEFYRILGLDGAESVQPERFLELVHPDDRDLVVTALRTAVLTGGAFSVDFRLRRPDGQERYLSSQGAVIRGADGAPDRLAGTTQDITEWKEAERALRQREDAERANQAKSEFLSRMSHELRTPLNAILGFAQLLTLERLAPDQSESVEQILRGGRHLLQLINEVLDLSRVEAGKLSLSLEPVPVAEVLRDALELLQPLATQRGITLRSEVDPAEGSHVLADAQRLKQVLLNLVSNGIKYNGPNGSVTIGTAAGEDGRLRIVVQDTGPGLSAEEMARLFVPFQRLRADAQGIEGTGLGLVLVRGIAEAMNGRTGVESTVGAGSRFWIELRRATAPVADRADDAGDRPSLPPSRLLDRTVLYIEDNPSNVRLVERVLAPLGVRLLTSMQGSLGIELAREHRPDLVLLDLNLPDLSGEQVLQQMGADPELRTTPVVVVSADAMAGQAERLLRAGARAYLTKPIDVPRFVEVVHGILEAGRSP